MFVSWLFACPSAPPAPLVSGPSDTGSPPTSCADGYPVVHVPDPAAAERGEAWLTGGGVGDAMIPVLALRNLWVVWGGGPLGEEAYWATFRDRYGLVEAPWDNDGYPLGLHAVGTNFATVDCWLCHADTAGGRVVLGVGNSRLDFQALYDDLVKAGELGGALGVPVVELPYTIDDATGAAGAVDAFGLAMSLSLAWGPPGVDVQTDYGYQQAAPWWTLSLRDRVYSDGSGSADNHRTMAATLLGFGTSPAALESFDDELLDVREYLWSMRAPAWPLPVDPSAARGREVYAEAGCAECHGAPCAPFPDRVIPVDEVGTDPARALAFGPTEAAWVNASWFGAPAPMTSTGGYLAPPLAGVWASAPYFHNGAVPDLWGVLDSGDRPAVWIRTGTSLADYDPVRGGWRYDVVAAPPDRSTPEARRVVDTSLYGMSADGHPYGDALDDADRAALIAWLVTQ